MTSVDVGLIREAGGLGDVLRFDSVARALKRRGTERVTAYGLHQYKEVFGRLSAIDEFVSVQIRFLSQRRSRSSNWQKADYLRRTIRRGHDRIVDLFCPGYLHEMRSDPPIFSRAEAFCLAAEVEPAPFEDLRPCWEVRPEDTALAENLGLLPQRPTIGLAIQATDPARTYGQQQRVGRSLRGTDPVRIWDMIDMHNHILRTHSNKRRETYESDGHKVTVGFPLSLTGGPREPGEVPL